MAGRETNRRNKKKFEPIHILSQRLFHKNKGRNLVAILAILMTTMMFTTLFTLAQSMSENLVEMTFRQTGYDAQASFKSIQDEQVEKLAAHPQVKEVGESIVLGLAENEKLAGKQVEIRWANNSYASHSFSKPTTGRLPQDANEAALDTVTLKRLGITPKIGEKVTLKWRKNLSDPKAETISKTFTLCGFWEGNESVYANMAWVSKSYVEEMAAGTETTQGQLLGTHMAQVTLHSARNIEKTMEQILSDTGLTELEYHVNLAYSPEMGATALQETLPMYLGMILVFVAGYLIIYNIFQISVTADVQLYGKLKTLGMTTKQIKKLIYGQSNRLCLIGIPAGLVLGWGLGLVLVPAFTGILGGESGVSVNPVIFLGSAVFAWLTVLISCLRPARLAGKVSPIEALRMSDADGKSKKTKRKKESASLYSMAWANLGRNKKRTITVVCSLTLGLVLLSCFYAKNVAFDMEKYLADLTIADFELSDATSEDYIGGYNPKGDTLNAALVKAMEAFEGVEAIGHQYSAQFNWKMDEQTVKNLQGFYTEEMLSDWSTYDPTGVKEFHKAVDTREMSAVAFGLDGIALQAVTQDACIMEGAFDEKAYASGKYVLAVGPAIEQGEEYPCLPTPSVGSNVELAGEIYEVMAVVHPLMPVDDGASETGAPNSMEMHFILPADTFQTQWPENTLRRLFVNVEDTHMEEMQEWLDDYSDHEDSSLPVSSRKVMAEQYEKETRSSAVMGNAISIIIALVGVLNFVNSMVTAIVSRRREFAMIQSVGMTKKQLCQMLIYEGLSYAGITLALSYLISALAVGVGIRAMVAGGFTTFHFTLLPLVICTPILLVFAVLIPYLCFKNLEKQSIVERLRME
ncbi:MAG: ABC transporter permease [Blautia sp.]|uniref:ABC transporter permease n=1 Tax=Blautia sp. TaxID=1955243 RepID=UPI002E79F780|nr:ABC transporter permease [Blautia sp.]MEE1443769.1 ABC transporter permease [Blautia sp.]